MQDLTKKCVPSTSLRQAKLDAIIVPASRPAPAIDGLIRLSADAHCALVVLCSGQTKVEHLADRAALVPNAQVLIIDVWADYSHPAIPTQTAARRFRQASAWRTSDLSLKRNVGLMIARLHGWRKIVFIDDDITLDRDYLARLGWELETHHIAGMACRKFPDNSVVCHARRLAGLPQDNFVSGAVLGVHCGDIPLPFFPDIYNEDWFFFSRAAAQRELANVGDALQATYDPYASPSRARREEFGDLIAEGLFSLFEDADADADFPSVLRTATPHFWDEFKDARRSSLDVTYDLLKPAAHEGSELARKAMESLDASRAQLALIKPHDCAEFVDAWRGDMGIWAKSCATLNNVCSTRVAMGELGFTSWRVARYRRPNVHSTCPEGSLHAA